MPADVCVERAGERALARPRGRRYSRGVRVGDVIGRRFMLERRAGAGGMGVVFQARDREREVPVALKCVVGTAQELERFAREVAILAGLDHPRVVRYVDHGEAGEARYLAMEWLAGEDLAQRLLRGPLAVADAVAVARGVAEALAVLHEHGVVHRDIKPSNVFLVAGQCAAVKLLDLGVARPHELDWSLTATGVTIGTPAYMAPEQARGEQVDARADLFSLGCLIFECLAERSPCHAEHPIAGLAKMLVEDAPRLADVGVAAPPALEGLLAGLLAKRPEERPPSAAALLAALDRWTGHVPVTAPLPRTALTSAEQRVASVVLTRPATDSNATLLPQESGELERRVRALVATGDARIERLPNGSFLAVFGGAGAPGDHAVRAAGLALALPGMLGGDTIALATGRGQISGRVPIGDVIDRAVALLAGGGLGIQLDAVTASLLAGRFEVADDGERLQLLGEHDHLEPRRTLLGRVTACVGRGRELAVLSAALASCVEERAAAVLLVTAPPGVGKSRLVGEFVRTLRARQDLACVLVGGCDVMSAGSAFGVVSRALQRLVRGAGGDPRAGLLARLGERLPAEAAGWTVELLGELAEAWGDAEVSETLRRLRGDPVLLGDAMAQAWRAWLAAECEVGPVVLVLEDLHWGDLPSVRLIDGTLRVLGDRPILVVATGRPEVHAAFPQLWAERGVHELRLGPLSARTGEQLARQVLGPAAAPDLVARIVERAGGHPFLLEELIRAAAAGSSFVGEVPDTVLAMLQSRFDALGEQPRAVLRAASVFGASFWLAGVEALLGGDSLSHALERLCAAELVERRPASALAGQREYAFRHGLVRDAAYAMLTDADRVTGHRLAGAWLEAAGERDARVLAEHFDRGGAAVSAARWYHTAASAALEGNDLAAAIDLAGRALDLGAEGHAQAASLLVLADAWYWRGDMGEAHRHALRAASSHPVGSDGWFNAVSAIVLSRGQQGGNDDVELWLRRAAEVATDSASDAHLICLCRGVSQLAYVSMARAAPYKARLDELAAAAAPGPGARGWLARTQAETTPYYRVRIECAAIFRGAREHFEAAGVLRHACLMHIFQCRTLSHSGHPQDAVRELDQVRAACGRLGVPYLGLFAALEHAVALFYADQDAACLELLAVHVVAARGSARLEALMRMFQAMIALDRGDAAGAEALARGVHGSPVAAAIRAAAAGVRVRALARLGRVDEALVLAEEALALAAIAQPDVFDDVAVIAVAELRLATGDEARARALVADAWAAVEALPQAPESRAQYRQRRIVRDLAALARRFGLAA